VGALEFGRNIAHLLMGPISGKGEIMSVGSGSTLWSFVSQPLLTTMMAALLNGATPSGPSDYVLQEPAASQTAGSLSASEEVPQSPGAQSSQPVQPRKPQKRRRWTGSLVDVGCMNNAPGRDPALDEALFPDPLSGFWQTLQNSQRAEQERKSGGWSPRGQPETPSKTAWTRDSDGEPEASEQQIAMQTAQLKRAKALEQVVKACTPTPPTSHYGLVISGGQVLKFDAAGDFKAKEAISVSAVEPGKALKVKVTGSIEAEDTVRVASIEFTHRIPAPRVSSGQ